MFVRRISAMLLSSCLAFSAQGQDTNDAFALEIFQQAVADNSCDMYQIVIDDYPDTTAAKLARVKLKTCSLASDPEEDIVYPDDDEPEYDEPAAGDPGFEHLGQPEGNGCNGYWTGSYCISDRRELTKELQKAYASLGCPVGRADGVWGKRTAMGVLLSNKYYGDNFRRGSTSREYGQLINNLYNLNYRLCECEPGRVLHTDGLCYVKNNSRNNSNRNYDQSGATCGWFALTTCSRRNSEANSAANRYGGYVIYTERSSYPNFSSGYYCAVEGPMNKSAANRAKNRARSRGASSAYIKNSCR